MQKINYSLVILLLFGFMLIRTNGFKNDYFADANEEENTNAESINQEEEVKAEEPVNEKAKSDAVKEEQLKADVNYDESGSNEEAPAAEQVAVVSTTLAVEQVVNEVATTEVAETVTEPAAEEVVESAQLSNLEAKQEEVKPTEAIVVATEPVQVEITTTIVAQLENIKLENKLTEAENGTDTQAKTTGEDENRNLIYIIILVSSIGGLVLVGGVVIVLVKKTNLCRKKRSGAQTEAPKTIYKSVPQNDDRI